MPYKAIIFDYDGTIVDTERVVYACWREVFREHGTTSSDGLTSSVQRQTPSIHTKCSKPE